MEYCCIDLRNVLSLVLDDSPFDRLCCHKPWIQPYHACQHASVGFLTISSIRHTIPEVKIIFLGMVAAMIIAGGIALLSFNILLCSAFTIEQQKQTGTLLTLLGIALYFFMAFILFSSLSKK